MTVNPNHCDTLRVQGREEPDQTAKESMMTYRCDEQTKSGDVCDRPLDDHGYCDRPRDHKEG